MTNIPADLSISSLRFILLHCIYVLKCIYIPERGTFYQLFQGKIF